MFCLCQAVLGTSVAAPPPPTPLLFNLFFGNSNWFDILAAPHLVELASCFSIFKRSSWKVWVKVKLRLVLTLSQIVKVWVCYCSVKFSLCKNFFINLIALRAFIDCLIEWAIWSAHWYFESLILLFVNFSLILFVPS